MIITAVVFCFIAVVGVALSFEHLALVVVVCGRYHTRRRLRMASSGNYLYEHVLDTKNDEGKS